MNFNGNSTHNIIRESFHALKSNFCKQALRPKCGYQNIEIRLLIHSACVSVALGEEFPKQCPWQWWMKSSFLPAPISYSLPHSPQFFRKFNSTNCVNMSQNTFPFLPIGFEHLLVHCCSGSFSFPFVRSVRQSVVSNQWKELLSRPVNFSEQEKIATDHSELITMQSMSARLNVINRKQLTINKS